MYRLQSLLVARVYLADVGQERKLGRLWCDRPEGFEGHVDDRAGDAGLLGLQIEQPGGGGWSKRAGWGREEAGERHGLDAGGAGGGWGAGHVDLLAGQQQQGQPGRPRRDRPRSDGDLPRQGALRQHHVRQPGVIAALTARRGGHGHNIARSQGQIGPGDAEPLHGRIRRVLLVGGHAVLNDDLVVACWQRGEHVVVERDLPGYRRGGGGVRGRARGVASRSAHDHQTRLGSRATDRGDAVMAASRGQSAHGMAAPASPAIPSSRQPSGAAALVTSSPA